MGQAGGHGRRARGDGENKGGGGGPWQWDLRLLTPATNRLTRQANLEAGSGACSISPPLSRHLPSSLPVEGQNIHAIPVGHGGPLLHLVRAVPKWRTQAGRAASLWGGKAGGRDRRKGDFTSSGKSHSPYYTTMPGAGSAASACPHHACHPITTSTLQSGGRNGLGGEAVLRRCGGGVPEGGADAATLQRTAAAARTRTRTRHCTSASPLPAFLSPPASPTTHSPTTPLRNRALPSYLAPPCQVSWDLWWRGRHTATNGALYACLPRGGVRVDGLSLWSYIAYTSLATTLASRVRGQACKAKRGIWATAGRPVSWGAAIPVARL